MAAGTDAQERITRFSLNDAVNVAARENPTVRAKEFERQAVSANEITAGLRPNPTANFLAEQFGGARDASQTQYTLSIGQPLELGGKRQRRVESARAATRVTGYELEDVRRQVIFQVKKSFGDSLVARETLALADENLKTLHDLERIQRFRAEKGDISELELLRIQVQRFAFERDAADARQALRAAKIALRATAGPERIAEDFDVVGDLTWRDIAPTQAALYRRALANRPDLRAAEATRERARADVKLARANAWWDVTPQIEYQRIGPDNTIGFGVSLPIRIFDRNQGEIARSRAEVNRVDATREAVAIQALSEADTALNVAPGEYRAAISFHTDTTAPLMSIADLSTVWVASDVPEPLVRLVRIGGPVTIRLVAFPDEVLTGKVTRLGDALDPQTRTLKVYVELPNPRGRFRPEMFGTVRHSGPLKRMPVLPAGAIVQEYGRNTVFVERAPGQYERRQVTVGPPVDDRVPVLSGVQSGDRVVVDGAMLIKAR